jgi:hypothetical protein
MLVLVCSRQNADEGSLPGSDGIKVDNNYDSKKNLWPEVSKNSSCT